MTAARRSETLGQIQRLFDEGTLTGLPDSRLLERFLSRRDEAAFSALVARHGPMVLATCRAVLNDPSAADDAFQATFLLLFRKARSIQGRDALGGWLHRVAYRVALQAMGDASRRRVEESKAGALRVVPEPHAADDLGTALHEEIERLPERFRMPVVLCDLEGLTRDEAAHRLRWTEGAVRGRLAKARSLLKSRLTRRGVTLAAPAGLPALPDALLHSTLKAISGPAGTGAASLVAAVAKVALVGRLKAVATVVITVASVGGVGLWGASRQRPDGGRPDRPVVAAARAIGRVLFGQGTGFPVSGRVVNQDGKPVAGATVKIEYVWSPPEGGLDAWIEQIKRLGKEPYGLPLASVIGGGPPPEVTTDSDGRFKLNAIERDRIAKLKFSGPGIETSEAYVLTRAVPPIRVKVPDRPDISNVVYYGATFEHATVPGNAVAGVVRDADTGAPIPGVRISGNSSAERSKDHDPRGRGIMHLQEPKLG